MNAGFEAKVYGTQASFYGKWYFEVTDVSPTNYGTSTGFHTVMRNFRFEPNASQINQLQPPGEVRKSTLTVKLMRGSEVISTERFTVVIYRADKPNFTIANASAVNEGDSAQFTITADRDPGSSPVTINFTPSNTNGEYLKITDSNGTSQPSGRSRTDDVMFSPSGAVWTGTLPIETVANTNDQENGLITVVLDEVTSSLTSLDYTTSPAPDNSATVAVNDLSKPEISIAPAPAIVSTENAEFTITASVLPWQPLAIKYTPTNGSGSNYLDPMDGTSGTERTSDPIIFTLDGAGPTATGTLIVPTTTDSNTTSGSIDIQLVDDTSSTSDSYDLSGSLSTTANVQITDRPSPVLSFNANSVSVDEGETATLVVTASSNPEVDEIDVSFTPTETRSDYLYTLEGVSGVSRTRTLNFTNDGNGNFTANLTLDTRTANGINEENGQIVITLDTPGSDSSYRIPNSPNDRITVQVNDTDEPVIVLGDAPTIVMGEVAMFPVTASIQPWQELEIRYNATSTGGNFLESVRVLAGEIRTSNVVFSPVANQPSIGTLAVPTVIDSANNAGSITITIANDANPTDYVRSTNANEREKTVMIQALSSPILSINSASASIDEGEMAKFIITASSKPATSLQVEYTPMDVSGSYLNSTANPTDVEKMEPLRFIQRFGSKEWTAEINLTTRVSDSTVQAGGDISVLLSPSDDSSSFTVASAPSNLATVSVEDIDIPIISIIDAPDIIVKQEANFTLVSNIQPSRTLGISFIVQETEGNFLDESDFVSGQVETNFFTFKPSSEHGFAASLIIDTELDPNSDSGKITVSIIDDLTNTPKHYTLSATPEDRIAEVDVVPIPKPTLSFSDMQMSASEPSVPNVDGVASVTIIASENPRQELDVKYSFVNLSGNFLKSEGTKTETLEFTRESDTDPWTADISIPLRPKNSKDEFSGKIRIELETPNSDANYEVTTSATARRTVIDVLNSDIPEIFINNIDDTVPGQNIIVELRSNLEPREPFSIRFTPTKDRPTDRTLDESYGQSGVERTTGPLTFVRRGTNAYDSAFEIPTLTNAQESRILVRIHEDLSSLPKFTIRSIRREDSLQTVQLERPTTANLRILGPRELTEGATHARFGVRAFPDPGLPITINYTPTNEAGHFLDTTDGNSGEARTVVLNFTRNYLVVDPRGSVYDALFDIPLRPDDGMDNEHGEIKIKLNDTGDYNLFGPTVHNNNMPLTDSEVTFRVFDAQTPRISIANAPDISATETAQFTLVSDIQPWKPVIIRYTPADTSGNFLGATIPAEPNNFLTQSVTFTQPTPDDPITGILTVPTVQGTGSGTITVTLLDDTIDRNNNKFKRDYTRNSDTATHSATVQIEPTASLKPTLSIKPSEENANEGGTAKFIITASHNPGQNALNVNWTYDELVGNFLDTTQQGQTTPTQTLPWVFSQAGGVSDAPWTHELILRLTTPANTTDEEHGKINVTLNTPAQNANYLVAESPLNTATKNYNRWNSSTNYYSKSYWRNWSKSECELHFDF